MSKGKKPDYYEPDSEYGYVRLPTMLSCAVDDTAITDRLLRYLVAIGSYSTRRNGNWCWPSRRKIAQRMGVSTTAVTKAMTTLAGLGYIEIRPRFENEAEEGKRGKQVSNYYRVLLDFELPPSRDRSLQERRRAGVGGRPKKSASDPPPPITPGVT
ncbi:MAG TPA: helix-turn-helix domain-containing protein, partial [Ktedonobacterales bacterium]|nr:helix-turn-helix domain-containing protein [Ktedonobacterales bacterium]